MEITSVKLHLFHSFCLSQPQAHNDDDEHHFHPLIFFHLYGRCDFFLDLEKALCVTTEDSVFLYDNKDTMEKFPSCL